MPPKTQIPFASDHDLLIRVDTKLDTLSGDLRELKDGTQKRLETLEREKFDASEAQKLKEDGDRVHLDHERRMRRIERWGFLAAGALGALEVVLALYVVFGPK